MEFPESPKSLDSSFFEASTLRHSDFFDSLEPLGSPSSLSGEGPDSLEGLGFDFLSYLQVGIEARGVNKTTEEYSAELKAALESIIADFESLKDDTLSSQNNLKDYLNKKLYDFPDLEKYLCVLALDSIQLCLAELKRFVHSMQDQTQNK